MKYYQIFRSAEPKVIGIKDGTSQVELITKDILSDKSFIDFDNHFNSHNKDFWQSQDKIQFLNPPTFTGVLRKKAKVTDIMQYGEMFAFLNYIYSERYYNIIKAFKIGQHKAFGFVIENVRHPYYLLYFETVSLLEISHEKSLIYTGNSVLNNVQFHKVASYEAYVDLKKEFPLARFKSIAIPEHYYGKDIIETQASGQPFYSEKLVDFLLDCKITGLEVNYNNSVQLEFV